MMEATEEVLAGGTEGESETRERNDQRGVAHENESSNGATHITTRWSPFPFLSADLRTPTVPSTAGRMSSEGIDERRARSAPWDSAC